MVNCGSSSSAAEYDPALSVSGDSEGGGYSSGVDSGCGTGEAPALVYEFTIPQDLVGRLIGKFGNFVNQIKSNAGVNIIVKRAGYSEEFKVCALEGSRSEIDTALNMIRERFPLKRYPALTLEQVTYDTGIAAGLSFLPANNKLNLLEGVVNDISVSCVVNLEHIFVQQPSHPTYPALSRLHQALKGVYDQPDLAPKLIQPFSPGVICIAHLDPEWVRAEVVAIQEEENKVTARLVDVGGYVQVSIDSLRQIRVDFVTIPFQATEVRLANVCPLSEEEGWTEEALNFFKILTQGHVLQANVIDYSRKDGVTLIHLYKLAEKNSHILINEELVTHGYAKWTEEAEQLSVEELSSLMAAADLAFSETTETETEGKDSPCPASSPEKSVGVVLEVAEESGET